MIKFSKDKVLLLHRLIAEETGGSIGVRDEALLDSALENAFAGFGEQEFYPTKEEKGARLGYTLISNHAFVDGNKRIGMYVMLTFLEVNGDTHGVYQRGGCGGRIIRRLRHNGLRLTSPMGARPQDLTVLKEVDRRHAYSLITAWSFLRRCRA